MAGMLLAIFGPVLPDRAAKLHAQTGALRRYDIPAQDVARALETFGRQSGSAIIFDRRQLGRSRSGAVKGELRPDEALRILLAPTGASARRVNARTFLVSSGNPLASPPSRAAQNDQAATNSRRRREQDAATVPDAGVVMEPLDENPIVVTGSRIVRDGYKAPTPVTVTPIEHLQKTAPANLVDALNQLPQFLNSYAPGRGSEVAINMPLHGNFPNLRGVGPVRMLILMDGVRVPPTTYTGTVNVDVLPQMLVQRVEVVTAGASAAYGSDAVAGVVNFVLDKSYTGIKGTLQTGISDRGDAVNRRMSTAAGFDVGEHGHVLLSYEHYESEGLLVTDRKRGREQWAGVGSVIGGGAAGSVGNPLVFRKDIRFGVATTGSVIVSGPFANTVFTEPGVYRPLDSGMPTGTSNLFMGGDYFYLDKLQASPDHRVDQAFGRFSYKVSDGLGFYAQGSVSRPVVEYMSPGNALLGRTLYSGNAFLPTELQAQLTATNTPSITFSRTFSGDRGNLRAREKGLTYTLQAGAYGKLGDMEWAVDYTHGKTVHKVVGYDQLDNRKTAAALDAVRDPSGNIVCRVELTNPGLYPGCVPLNILGVGAPSDAAWEYVTSDSRYRAENISDYFQASISGDLLSLWAGPVSFAIGGEYRRQELALTSNADPAIVRPVTGLRGIAVTEPRFYYTNLGIADGKLNVKEAFGEIIIPLAKDLPFVRSLEFNGAVRHTDYSTSGGVTTWKLGGVWNPVDDLTVRITKSRDIRAPTLHNLFAGPTFGLSGVFDPRYGTSLSIPIRGGGNPSLKPEIGKTFAAGAVLQPRFLPGFSLSVDYWNLRISSAITLLTGSQVLRDCQATGGSGDVCALITRDPVTDQLLEVTTFPLNLARLQARGIDFDASYRRDLGQGRLSLRLFAAYLDRYRTQQSVNAPVIDPTGRGTISAAYPRFKGNLTINYETGPFSIFVQERMIGRLRIGGSTTNDNYAEPAISPQFYTDLTLAGKVPAFGGDVEFFTTVSNLFDDAPPLVASPTASNLGYPTIASLYDWIGRTYTVGARFKF